MTKAKGAEVVLIKGDGIGPEICDSVLTILNAAGCEIDWVHAEAGLEVIRKHKVGIRHETLELLEKVGVALKGPTTTPVGGGHKSINVLIRKALDLYANLRPSKSLPGIEMLFHDLDLVIVRENVEDTYAGIERYQSPNVAQCLKITTRSGSLRTHRYAFEFAKREGRKKVTCVHKANIMKLTDGLFLETFYEVAKEYPDITAGDIIVDNCCMQLVTRPAQFNVLVLPNLYGDIVSDLCAGLVGGLGVAAGANIGKNCAIFEAVHGSAPDIAGKDLANPTALLTSSIMLLRHIGKNSHAEKIEKALRWTLQNPLMRTRDLGGMASTQEFTRNVIESMDYLASLN